MLEHFVPFFALLACTIVVKFYVERINDNDYDDMLSRFDITPERDRRTDVQTKANHVATT